MKKDSGGFGLVSIATGSLGVAWVISTVISLAVMVLLGYVALHFIAKFW